jgi:glyoxylase-like metal-dependent hydrolase (beta-lactamase superfamily II)
MSTDSSTTPAGVADPAMADSPLDPATGRPDWNTALLSQLVWHWHEQLRPRLAGLTDDEYFWEPVPGCWNVRPRGTSTAPVQAGSGPYTIDFAFPPPEPPPVTTIAWRIAHLVVGVFGMRNAGHFGGPPMDYAGADYPGTAAGALSALDDGYARWVAGVRSLGGADRPGEGLLRAVGEAEGPYAEYPYATLVLHIHREVIHHGAEISLLRDLYAHRDPLRPRPAEAATGRCSRVAGSAARAVLPGYLNRGCFLTARRSITVRWMTGRAAGPHPEGLVQIGPGVWAFLRPPGGWGQTNTGLVIADGASLVVDTVWDAGWAERVSAAMAPLVAAAPITEAVNTHADADHWWGNARLPPATRITTSERARGQMRTDPSPARMRAMGRLARLAGLLPGRLGALGGYTNRVLGGARFPAGPLRLPDQVFTDQLRVDLAGRGVQLREVGPAHTRGDVIVYLADSGIVFAGDIVFAGSTPILWHGPLGNWIEALELLLHVDPELIVPGHGPLAGAAEVRALRDYWQWVSVSGRAGYDAGRSPLEAARRLVAEPEFRRWRHWACPERLVISLHTLYRLWSGRPAAPPTVVQRARAFTDAGLLLRTAGRPGTPGSP